MSQTVKNGAKTSHFTSHAQSIRAVVPQKTIGQAAKMNEFATDLPIENVRTASQESKYKFNENY